MLHQHTPPPMSPATIELVGQIGHDFNNLLGIILGGLSLLRDDLPANAMDAELKEILDDALSATREASEVIEELNTAAGRQIAARTDIDLNRIILNVSNDLRETLPKEVMLQVETSNVPVTARVDPAALTRSVRELADNALRAIGETGTLRLMCTATPQAQLIVEDDGPGMAQDILERCTLPYVTNWRASGHRGLGLSVLHGLMMASHGSLTIHSAEGQGTRVHLVFPLAGSS